MARGFVDLVVDTSVDIEACAAVTRQRLQHRLGLLHRRRADAPGQRDLEADALIERPLAEGAGRHIRLGRLPAAPAESTIQPRPAAAPGARR